MNTRKVFGLALAVLMPLMSMSVSAESYTYDLEGNSVAAPDAYTATKVYIGTDLAVGSLASPQDLYVDTTQNVYIADTQNNRVLVFDANFRHTRTLEQLTLDGQETTLSEPKGVFAAENGLIYICDTGNARVLAVDETNTVVRLFTSEGLVAINQNINFQPEKVAVDSDGNVYVVDRMIYQGIVQYDAQGNFIRFFAPNEVKVTASVIWENIWKNFLTDIQIEAMTQNMPLPYSNLYIDKDNFLYTAAIDVDEGQELKCLNALGNNILQGADSTKKGFGDLEITFDAGKEEKSQFVDVHVDEQGIVCGADSRRGHLFLYDQEGSLLAVFGGSGSYKGSFRSLVAVDKLGDSYLALDSEKNSLTIFSPTPYFVQVREALSYYQKGLYAQTVEQWNDILKENAHFPIAYRSIGRALLQEGAYREAMDMLREGGDEYFYSLAFKEYRKEFVRRNFLWIVMGSAAVLTAVVVIVRRLRRWMLSAPKKGKAI